MVPQMFLWNSVFIGLMTLTSKFPRWFYGAVRIVGGPVIQQHPLAEPGCSIDHTISSGHHSSLITLINYAAAAAATAAAATAATATAAARTEATVC